jgi:hypothetical protein
MGVKKNTKDMKRCLFLVIFSYPCLLLMLLLIFTKLTLFMSSSSMSLIGQFCESVPFLSSFEYVIQR